MTCQKEANTKMTLVQEEGGGVDLIKKKQFSTTFPKFLLIPKLKSMRRDNVDLVKKNISRANC